MSDTNDTIGREVYPLPILIYGRPNCDDTAPIREKLKEMNIPFVEIDVDSDADAARYVETINHGKRVTPTIVFGDEAFIIVEPVMGELIQALRRARYAV